MTFGKDLNLYSINFDLYTVDKLYRFNKICDIRVQIYDCATSYFTDLTYNVCFFGERNFENGNGCCLSRKLPERYCLNRQRLLIDSSPLQSLRDDNYKAQAMNLGHQLTVRGDTVDVIADI